MKFASSPLDGDTFEPLAIIMLRSITSWLFYEYQTVDKPCSHICPATVLHILYTSIRLPFKSEILALRVLLFASLTSLINYQLPRAPLKTPLPPPSPPFVFPLTTRVLSRLISYMHDICINRTVISALFLHGSREDELLIHPWPRMNLTDRLGSIFYLPFGEGEKEKSLEKELVFSLNY